MVDEGIKITHREETFNDHAVKELADLRGRCLCCLQFERCSDDDCKCCSINRRYKQCISQMNDYDRTRLNAAVADAYSKYSMNPESFMSYKRIKKYYLKWILFCLACLLGAIFCFSVQAYPYKNKAPGVHVNTSAGFDAEIKRLLRMSNENVYDVNKDKKINCIDYAVSFKKEWDKKFNSRDCMIVRNYNEYTGFHHLFVTVFDHETLRWVDIETAITNMDSIDKFQMIDAWGDKYDLMCNKHGETRYWLGGGVYSLR